MANEVIIESLDTIAYENNIPLDVTIELLTKCNLECKHCYIPEHNNNGLSTDKIINILYELRKLGTLNLTFTGGEIFLRKDIFQIIETARNLHFRVNLLSNATLLNDEKIKKLSTMNIKEYSISIYSLNNSVHDNITQVPGSLEKTLTNISLLKKYNIPIEIKAPLMNENYKSYTEIKKFCYDNDYKCEFTTTITSKNNGDHSTYSLRLSEKELLPMIRNIEFNNSNLSFNPNDDPCKRVFYSLYIDCIGNVYPCNSFLYKLGNINENTLIDIWNNSDELKKLKSIKNKDLSECINCSLKNYCNRCPGLALSEDNTLLGCSSSDKALAIARKQIVNY